jgi:hypothetical protein
MKRPKLYPRSDFNNLSKIVGRGEYHLFKNRNEVPAIISEVGGFPSSDNYQATILMASSTSSNPPTIGGIVPASSSPIYRLSVIRRDIHADGVIHANKDDVLIFADARGHTLQKRATDKTKGSEHFIELSQDSGLDIPMDIYNLPNTTHGKLSDLAESKINIGFSTGPRQTSKK